ncbi:MAG: hypothetical protein PXX73_04685 [Sideroxydans sp.]|nr:hypothetical protein [Sideroxydans sp.]
MNIALTIDASSEIEQLKAFFNWYVEFNPNKATWFMNEIRTEFFRGISNQYLTPERLEKMRQAVIDGFLPDLTVYENQKTEVSSGAKKTGDVVDQ